MFKKKKKKNEKLSKLKESQLTTLSQIHLHLRGNLIFKFNSNLHDWLEFYFWQFDISFRHCPLVGSDLLLKLLHFDVQAYNGQPFVL